MRSAYTARGLKRGGCEDTCRLAMLSACKNFVGKREKFVFGAFVDRASG